MLSVLCRIQWLYIKGPRHSWLKLSLLFDMWWRRKSLNTKVVHSKKKKKKSSSFDRRESLTSGRKKNFGWHQCNYSKSVSQSQQPVHRDGFNLPRFTTATAEPWLALLIGGSSGMQRPANPQAWSIIRRDSQEFQIFFSSWFATQPFLCCGQGAPPSPPAATCLLLQPFTSYSKSNWFFSSTSSLFSIIHIKIC